MPFPFWKGNSPFYRRGIRQGRRGQKGQGGNLGVTKAQQQQMFSLSNLSATNFLQTQNPGAEPGVATGWGFGIFCRPEAFVTGSRVLASMYSFPTGGYELRYDETAGFRFLAGNAAGPNPGPLLVNSDWGKLQLVICYYDGTNFQIWIGRRLAATVAATFVPVPSSLTWGARAGAPPTLPATGMGLLGGFTFRGTPNTAQLEAVYDAVRTRGDVPETMLGATIGHRWSVKDELRGVSNPAGRKTYGARGFGGSGAHYQSAQGANTGIVGSASGFYAQAYIRPTAIISSNYFLARWSGPAGFMLEHANTVLSARFGNGTTSVTSPTFTIGATANTMLVMTAVWDQPAQKLRLFIDGVEIGTGTAMTAYVPLTTATERMYIGRYSGSGGSDGGPSVFQVAGGDFIPTAAQLLAQVEATRQAGKLVPIAASHFYDIDADVKASGNFSTVPAVIVDRVGTDNLFQSGNLEVAVDTAVGPPAPVQLTDTITRSAVDALLRTGNPIIKTIDPTVDGRRTLGAQGFNAANRYVTETLNPPGMVGATAHWKAWYGSFGAGPVAGTIFECINISTLRGWGFETNGSGWVRMSNYNNGTNGATAQYTIPSGVYNRPLLLIGVTTGTVARLYVDDGTGLVQIGADAACSGYIVPTGVRGALGMREDGSGLANTNVSHYGIAGGNVAITLAEAQQFAADVRATGRIPLTGVAGKTAFAHDLTTDILASGVDAVPTQVLDRVGTDHLTRVGPEATVASFKGLRLSASGQLATALNGGVIGTVTASTVSLLFSPLAAIAGTAGGHYLAARNNGTPGWVFRRLGSSGANGTLSVSVAGAGGGTYAIQNADLGTLMHLAWTYDGTTVRFYVNGVLNASSALATLTLPTSQLTIGYQYGDATAGNGESAFFGLGGGAYVATQAELAAQAAASIAVGRLVTIPGKTDDRLYTYSQDAVDQSTVLPSKCVNRASNGVSDDMMRIGAGLTLAQRTERLWSYEVKPIIQGAASSTNNQYWLINNGGAGGFLGHAAGFWMTVSFMVTSQAVAARTRHLWNRYASGVGGMFISTSGLNSLISMTAIGSALGAGSASPSVSIAATDVGKVLTFTGVYTGSTLLSYMKRAQQGSSTALSGFVPWTAGQTHAMIIPGGSSVSDGINFFGIACGNGIPTLAEIQAQTDAITSADGDIRAIPGKTDRMWSVTKSYSNGAVQSLTELIYGNAVDLLPKSGNGLISAPQYARMMAA